MIRRTVRVLALLGMLALGDVSRADADDGRRAVGPVPALAPRAEPAGTAGSSARKSRRPALPGLLAVALMEAAG